MSTQSAGGVCLIVDDERGVRTYLKALLETRDIECVMAADTAQAFERLRAEGHRIDLIISDVNLPGAMNGADFAREVRKEYPAKPVILISGAPEDVPSGFPFLHKPFRPAAILAAIDATRNRTRAAS